MKWMKWFLVVVASLVTGLGMAGCGGGDDGNSDPLVGTWSATAFNGQAMPKGIALTIVFRDNGTVESRTTINGTTEKETSTWSAANGIITIVSSDGTDRVPYSVSGNTLTLADSEGAFTLKRK